MVIFHSNFDITRGYMDHIVISPDSVLRSPWFITSLGAAQCAESVGGAEAECAGDQEGGAAMDVGYVDRWGDATFSNKFGGFVLKNDGVFFLFEKAPMLGWKKSGNFSVPKLGDFRASELASSDSDP